MKKIIFVFAMAILVVACNNEKKEPAETAAPAATADVKFPYDVAYSKFEPGNPEYTAMILQGSWKDWEENKLDKTKWLADTITAVHSDNMVTHGADSLMARWKRFRSELSSSVPTIDAVMSVHATVQNENWVLVWATTIDTKPDGKKDTIAINEAWRINKDGKADMLLQFDRANRKK